MKKLLALLAVLTLTFVFSTTCFAAKSPSQDVLPIEESTNPNGGNGNGDGDGNGTPDTSDKSPQTGADLAAMFAVVITAAGITLIARKKYSQVNE